MKKNTFFMSMTLAFFLSACRSASTSVAPSAAPETTAVHSAASASETIVFPKIDRYPPAAVLHRGEFTLLPSYDPETYRQWQVDLRSLDLSKLDLRGSLNDLLFASFDDKTIWPPADRLPEEFDWRKIRELGMNPGLGIRSLHQEGITGEGIGIAVIDQTLLVDHREYADRLRLYEEYQDVQATRPEADMHGLGVASIAVGKTVGTAPGADLYFIANGLCYSGTGG
jgi:hypothetical protein